MHVLTHVIDAGPNSRHSNTFDYVLLSDLKNKVITVVLQSTLRAFIFTEKRRE